MHEFLASISFLVDGGGPVPASGDTSSLKIAIVTAISIVIAAAITAAATTIQRRREQPPAVSRDLIAELQRRAATAEAQVTDLSEKRETLQEHVDELEGYCWQNGVDPRTGGLIHREGSEDAQQGP